MVPVSMILQQPLRKHRRSRNEFSLTSSSHCGTPSPSPGIYTSEQNPFEFAIQKEVGKRKRYLSVTERFGAIFRWKYIDVFCIFFIGFLIGTTYLIQTKKAFETVTNFSLLSHIERELTLPKDVAFRYTYYKKIAQARSLRIGLQSVLYDKGTKWPDTTNAFQAYFLSPEVLIGTSYHLFKTLASLPIFSNASRCSYGQFTEKFDLAANAGIIDHCPSIIYFYLNWLWLIEGCAIGLLVYFGYILSNSCIGCAITGVVIVLSHPQKTNADWIFPGSHTLVWTVALAQIYLISTLVLRKTHPPWITSVKIGIGSAVLILISGKEAQWVLGSQLVIVMLMQIWGQLSSYVTSLVIFGQITGWQYASLVHLDTDTSLVNWSIYLYILLTVIITLYLVQPVLNWLLDSRSRRGEPRRQKWIFLRRTFLLIAFQMTLIIVWTELSKKLSLPQDRRFTFSSWTDSSSAEMSNKDVIRLTSKAFRTRDQVNQSKVEFPELELRADIVNRSTSRSGFDSRSETADFHHEESDILRRVYSCFYQEGSNKGNPPMLQTLVFILLTLCLDSRWELLLTAHLCLLLSLLFHSKVRDYYRKISSNFGIGIQVHWGLVAGLLACFVATSKFGSEQMYRNSRGRFELGNPRVTELLETVSWIKGTTNVTTCGLLGLESDLVFIHLSSGRGCVNHNQVHDIHFMLAAAGNRTGSIQKRRALGESEEKVLWRVYSMFRTDLTFQEYFALLTPLRATHLVLSKAHCTRDQGVGACDMNHLWDRSPWPIQNSNQNTLPASAENTTVCYRLINHRNITPFIKVFENQGYAIFALDSKPKPKPGHKPNKVINKGY